MQQHPPNETLREGSSLREAYGSEKLMFEALLPNLSVRFLVH